MTNFKMEWGIGNAISGSDSDQAMLFPILHTRISEYFTNKYDKINNSMRLFFTLFSLTFEEKF